MVKMVSTDRITSLHEDNKNQENRNENKDENKDEKEKWQIINI